MNKIKFTTKFYIRLFWAFFAIPILTVILLFGLISFEKLGKMPTFEELENPENNLASEFYSADRVLLGTVFWDNRSYANYEEIPQNIIDALIATEDVRFHKHSGIDARGLGRVLVYSILLNKSSSGGGSTITQQLAKNLFPRDTSTYKSSVGRNFHLGISKFKEWIIAVKLERNYTKNEIIGMYLNTVPFGGITYGIKSASQTYFNKPPDSLRVEESALLVGLLKAPSYYSPVRHPERSKLRRNVVLNQMNKYEFITSEEFDSLSILPIELNYKVQDHNAGLATYFREYLRLTLNKSKPNKKNYFSWRDYRNDSIARLTNPLYRWCKKNQKTDG